MMPNEFQIREIFAYIDKEGNATSTPLVKNQIKPEIIDETKIIKPGWVKLTMLKSNNIILKEFLVIQN